MPRRTPHGMVSQHGDIGIIGPHDLLVCFSKSGATEEIIRLVPFAKASAAWRRFLVGLGCHLRPSSCACPSLDGRLAPALMSLLSLVPPLWQAKGARLVSITSVPGSPLEEVRAGAGHACMHACLHAALLLPVRRLAGCHVQCHACTCHA